MCPACYINGLLFLIFGASGAAIAHNPWIMALSVLLTVAGLSWMCLAYIKNKGHGGFKTNAKNTMIYFAIFVAGYVTAAYTTHDYFKQIYSESSSKHDQSRP